MTGARIATSAKPLSKMNPASALRLETRARATLPTTPDGAASGADWVGAASVTTLIAISLLRGLPRARVEPGGEEVGRQHGDQDRHGDQEEERLQQREVLVVDGLQEHEAQPGVVE